jgi:hypothetical protein
MWQVAAADQWSGFKPMLRDNLVWVGNGQGQLVGVSLKSGQTARTLDIGGTIRGFHMSFPCRSDCAN